MTIVRFMSRMLCCRQLAAEDTNQLSIQSAHLPLPLLYIFGWFAGILSSWHKLSCMLTRGDTIVLFALCWLLLEFVVNWRYCPGSWICFPSFVCLALVWWCYYHLLGVLSCRCWAAWQAAPQWSCAFVGESADWTFCTQHLYNYKLYIFNIVVITYYFWYILEWGTIAFSPPQHIQKLHLSCTRNNVQLLSIPNVRGCAF